MLKYHLPCPHVQFYWTLGPRFLDLVSAFTRFTYTVDYRFQMQKSQQILPLLKLKSNHFLTFRSGLGILRPAGRMWPARPFYAAREHLKKYKLLS